jgi:4-amino-4-deoxy-L-arabinose transferase-like glycosyltransferase
MPTPEREGWWRPAFRIVAAITLARLVLLWFNRTDLFVDETQYWLWSLDPAFGYYSKPPLIAWVIGAMIWVVGNDTPFWIRAPGPLLHGATALILAALAVRQAGARIAVWVAATYATLPMVAVGSLLISTDTVMAPFFAAALLWHARTVETRRPVFAVLAGLAAGMAFLAKYAAVYFLLGAGIGALLIPALRIGWRNGALLLAGFGVVVAPNLIWNLMNGLATLSHTADNVGWLREGASAAGLDPGSAVMFLLQQAAVFGPLTFAALVWAMLRPAGYGRLLVFSVPALVAVTAQALLSRAYANWAASAYFAGTVPAVQVLATRRGLLVASLVVNGAISLALPLLTLMPKLALEGQPPLLARHVGRVDMSRQILSVAEVAHVPIVADRRDVLADLYYVARRVDIAIYAVPPKGRAMNHFEQTRALPRHVSGRVLLVTEGPPVCDGAEVTPEVVFDTAGGAYRKIVLAGYLVDAMCLHAPGR